MNITITDAAIQQLRSYRPSSGERFRLVYDTEGCGCAVSGIAGLWLVDTKDDDEVPADVDAPDVPVSYLQRQAVFFEDRLKLDYLPERRAFRLSSDGQIYGSGITVADRRAAKPTLADASR